ncbi:MAG: hypothetical protein ACKOSO_12030 [Actinomycetota bacterium]
MGDVADVAARQVLDGVRRRTLGAAGEELPDVGVGDLAGEQLERRGGGLRGRGRLDPLRGRERRGAVDAGVGAQRAERPPSRRMAPAGMDGS